MLTYLNYWIVVCHMLFKWSPAKTARWARRRYGFPRPPGDPWFYHEAPARYLVPEILDRLCRCSKGGLEELEMEWRVMDILQSLVPESDFIGLPDLSMVPIAEVEAIANRYDWEEVRRQLSQLCQTGKGT